MGACWAVRIGTEFETLITAFLFSEVSTCGVETMLTRFSEASVFNIAKNLSVAKDHAVNPAGSGPNTLLLPRNWFAGA